jgi:hypothetical protein
VKRGGERLRTTALWVNNALGRSRRPSGRTQYRRREGKEGTVDTVMLYSKFDILF